MTAPANDHRSCQSDKGNTVGMPCGNTFDSHAVYLGIDPGLRRTGYAVIQRTMTRPVLLEGGVISSRPSASLAERVLEIGKGIEELLREFQPQGIAIEQVFSLHKNPKTAVLMAHARGAILFAIAAAKCTPVHYTPRQIKRLLTGSGAASKEQVQQAVQRELGLSRLLEPNDVADACAIALCHYYSLRTGNLQQSAVS